MYVSKEVTEKSLSKHIGSIMGKQEASLGNTHL